MSVYITDEERQLLDGVFASENAGSNRALYIHQKEALMQLRGAREYLARKYPGIRIRCAAFDPLTKGSGHGTLTFSADGHTSLFRVIIRSGSMEYDYTDTLYGELVRGRYDEELTALLSAFMGDVNTRTVFYTPLGMQDDASLTVEGILHHDPLITRHTDIFTDTMPVLSDRLLDTLHKGGWYASYTLFSAKEKDTMFANELSGSTAGSLSFRVFPSGHSEGEQP
ncbi:MAG: hypothetical protein K6G61_10650 [Solobacterium sp.]|nr:hypothetical protein [Solobacterium sp.]